MKLHLNVNQSILWFAIFTIAVLNLPFSQAQETAAQEKKATIYMLILPAEIPTTLLKNTESINQVIIRTVLMTKKFELMFARPDSFQDAKFRIYELKTVIKDSEKSGFVDIKIDLNNPKIQKMVRFEEETAVSGKRLLHTVRLMVLRLLFGESFLKKYKEKLDKMSDQDAIIAIPALPGKIDQTKGVPSAKEVKPLKKEPKKFDEVSEEGKKKQKQPDNSKDAPTFREKNYILGAYFQRQTVTSSGSLLDTNNNFSALLLDLHTHWKLDPVGENLAIFSARYGKTITSYQETIPDSLQLNGLYDSHLFSKVRGLVGLQLDRSHFGNLPELNQGIQVGTVTTLWAQFGLETSGEIFSRRFLVNLNLLKSLQSKTDFPGASSADIAGHGYSGFFACELTRKYFLALELSNYVTTIVASTSRYSNSDQRLSMGLYYPLENK
jgi:hypothetical protein